MISKPFALLAAALATSFFSISASAQVGYVTNGQDGRITRSGYGLCVHTGYWTPANAIAECDADLAKPAVPVAAPSAPAAAAPAPAPIAPAAPKPKPVAEKVTFAADVFFDFDKSVIKPEGKSKLDDLVAKMRDINLEVVIAIGHTDSIGSDAYNQRLSVRRAEAVKAYLVSKGIEANRVYTEGKGERQPIADNKTRDGRAKNRRTEIEVIGTRK